MDKNARVDHLLNLLGLQKDHLAYLRAQRRKLDSHHASRERDRAILHNAKEVRRTDKAVRSLERAVRNEKKRSS